MTLYTDWYSYRFGGKLTCKNPHKMDFYWKVVFTFTKVFLLFPIFKMRNSKPAIGSLTTTGPKESDFKWHSQRSLFLFAKSLSALYTTSQFLYLSYRIVHWHQTPVKVLLCHMLLQHRANRWFLSPLLLWNENNTD